MTRKSRDELRTRLLAIFQEEAADHLRGIAREMEELARAQDAAAAGTSLQSLFRIVHTFKGAARSLSIRVVEQLCHEIEDLCSELVQGHAAFDAAAHGHLRELTQRLEIVTRNALAPSTAPPAPDDVGPAAPAPAPPPAPAVPAAPAPSVSASPREAAAPVRTEAAAAPRQPAAPSFVRVETGQIQRLGLMAEELLGPRLAGQARSEEARGLAHRVAEIRRQLRGAGRARGEGGVAGGPADELTAIEQSARRLATALAEDSRALRVTADALMMELRRARLMPAGDLLAVFPDMVADLAREMGKAISWRTSGADLLIDREVAERIKDPLIHAVRNAIDHGIEPADARAQAGKPAVGTVALAIAPADGGRVAIEVSDDGAGIDVEAVRAVAVRSRMLTADEARDLPEIDVLDLVFQSSLSTRGVISAVSGRGLGLAIVRERAERLGGSVRLRSTPGAGTVLRLEVPAALANFRGIAVKVGDADFILPRDAVERTFLLPAAVRVEAFERGVVQFEGGAVPFAHLSRLLGGPRDAWREAASLGSALVVRHGLRRGIVAVDEMVGECEVMVKELRQPLLRVRHVMAAGMLGSGRLALILRTADVLDAMAMGPSRLAVERPSRPTRKQRLLIVDDSLTTRAMECGLLEAAGYEVEAVADGMEAWSALQLRPFDAVISDVDMPHMNGFELTERIRADPRLKQLPVVLVTALEERKDHDLGLKLGANAYMMKSAFDQSLLIDLVRRVL